MTKKRPLASVEEVRAELRRLGYLATGLDRFVLSGAGAVSPIAASARAALRLGLLGGAVFGVALSLAAAGLEPRLFAAPQDLVVLALYLTAVSSIGVALLAFLAGLAAGWYGRRGGRRPGPTLSRNVGLALAVAGLVYLGFWLRSHAATTSLPVRATAVALGLGLCLALGRFGFLAAVAVLAAGGVSDRLPEASLSRRHMLRLLAAAALLLVAGVAAASYFGGGQLQAPPDFAVIPSGLRVRVLGVDGLDARMAEQMMGKGELPHLAQLLRSGAHGRLSAEPEQVPAIVWTTLATGRGPESHGIQSVGARRLAGMRTPVAFSGEGRLARAVGAATDLLRLTRAQPPTAVLRGAKAFWNVASDKGLRVGVVNWWATWPAEPVNGHLISDRAFFKLEKGGPPDREVHPASAFDRLRELVRSGEADRARRLDRFALDAARVLRSLGSLDLEAIYLPGLDIVTMQQLGETEAPDLATLDARLDLVRVHYRFTDALIGEVATSLGPSDVLILVGDPGRLARRASVSPEGLLVMAGAGVAAGDLGRVTERDLAPTVLHLAGLPLSRELRGRAMETALSPEFRQAHPLRAVDSYGRRPSLAPAESGFDREMIEELKSLGYIK